MKNCPSEPIDIPNPGTMDCGGWKKFRILKVVDMPYKWRVECCAGLFDYWQLFANASSLDSAFKIIPRDKWPKTKIEYDDCFLDNISNVPKHRNPPSWSSGCFLSRTTN